MHRWENYAECVFLQLWLRYNGKQCISIRARWQSVFCAINYPGSWANGTLTAHFISHITKRIGDYEICVDQGFLELVMQLVFLSGLYLRGAPVNWIVLSVIIWFDWVTFILLFGRQVNGECVDYRGHSLAVKKCLPTDKDKRRLVLECTIFVHNFRTELVGLNEIAEVLHPEYKNVINIHGYDWIQRYYLQPGDYETNNKAKLI